jgi:hypothetical protein
MEATTGQRIFVEGLGTGEVKEHHSEEEHTIKFDLQKGEAIKVKLLRSSNGGKTWLLPPLASAETDWEANGAKDLEIMITHPRAASVEGVCLWMHRHKEPIVQLHAGQFGWTKLREDDQPGVNGDELLRLSDHEKLKTRLHVVTESHRQALLDAIEPLAGYLWRYRMVEGPPVHLSRSADAGYAQDELAKQEVCVKRMTHWEQFKAEIDARFKDDGTPLSTDAVITVLRWHTPHGETLVDRAGQKEEPQHTSKDDKHPYALVMARGERSLHDACAKERIAGYDIETVIEVFHSTLLCVQDLHDSGVCHADLKQR